MDFGGEESKKVKNDEEDEMNSAYTKIQNMSIQSSSRSKKVEGQSEIKKSPWLSQMAHMQYMCPGLHGPECRQRIEPMSFEKYLTTSGRLIIPLFQRAYCWGKGSSQQKSTFTATGT